jgi:hypothetical protein
MANKVGWFLGWMAVGFAIAVALFVLLVHVAGVRVEKQKEYRQECFEWGPRDSDGDPVCDRDFMPSYTSTGPYFGPKASAVATRNF